MSLGSPRLHFRRTDSTNARARELAGAGAPHGTVVTAAEQTAGRGRQGRTWSAPAGSALLCSVVVRNPPRLLPLAAGVAVAQAVEEVLSGSAAQLKWPNDVLLEGRKVAGILVEGRPQEHWGVVGVGVNVALALEELPAELRDRAGTLGLSTSSIELVLDAFLRALDVLLAATPAVVLDAVRARDALLDQSVAWADGTRQGVAAGIDDDGRLLVRTPDGTVGLDAGEVHLARRPPERTGR